GFDPTADPSAATAMWDRIPRPSGKGSAPRGMTEWARSARVRSTVANRSATTLYRTTSPSAPQDEGQHGHVPQRHPQPDRAQSAEMPAGRIQESPKTSVTD